MAGREPAMASLMSEVNQPTLLLLAEAAADRAARVAADQAVRQTFLVLGVDLADEEAVRITRDCFLGLRQKWERSHQRSEAWRKGVIHAVISAVIMGAATLVGVLWHTKTPITGL